MVVAFVILTPIYERSILERMNAFAIKRNSPKVLVTHAATRSRAYVDLHCFGVTFTTTESGQIKLCNEIRETIECRNLCNRISRTKNRLIGEGECSVDEGMMFLGCARGRGRKSQQI